MEAVRDGKEQRKCKEVLLSNAKGDSSSRVEVHRGHTQNHTELACQVLHPSVDVFSQLVALGQNLVLKMEETWPGVEPT